MSHVPNSPDLNPEDTIFD